MNRANITVTISTPRHGWKIPKKGESEKEDGDKARGVEKRKRGYVMVMAMAKE